MRELNLKMKARRGGFIPFELEEFFTHLNPVADLGYLVQDWKLTSILICNVYLKRCMW
jgi:hypothetical protein